MDHNEKNNPCKITLHMVSSLDGYIAKNDNSTSWFETFDQYEHGIAEIDAYAYLKSIDCYVMGANTYELAIELSKEHGWPYGEVPTYVLSHRNLSFTRPNLQQFSGDLHQLVNEILKPQFNNVWVVGGASLVNDLIRLQLADEIRQTILPILLGNGKRFFEIVDKEQALHLHNVVAYKSGLVELSYHFVDKK